MKGIVYASVWTGQYQHPTSDWILQNTVRPMGANWIRITTGCAQANLHSMEFNCSLPQFPSESDLQHATKLAHQLGMRVMLDLAVGFASEGAVWHGMIGQGYSENDWTQWFANYTKAATNYAEFAAQNQIDAYNISSELESTVHREKQWREVVAAVRKVYTGPLLFSLGTPAAWEAVQFWDAVDYIGIHPYDFKLAHSSQPGLADLETAWKPQVDRLEKLAKKWNRPIVITELGYPSMDGIGMDMNNYANNPSPKVNLQESALLYQALLDSFSGKDWFHGFFPLGIFSYGNPSNSDNILFSVAGKPAEDVIRKFYGAPPLPAPASDPPAPAEFKNIQVIYDDKFENGWYYSGDLPRNQFAEREKNIALSGSALQVTLPRFGELPILNYQLSAKDLNSYQWLEFYLFIAPGSPRPLLIDVSLRDGGFYKMPYFALLPSPRWTDGNQQVQGKWQRILIPLQALGPIVWPIQQLVFTLNKQGPATFYLDQIRLLGN
jgi:hypothetical protein